MMMENNIGIEVVVLLDYLKRPVLTYKGVVVLFSTPDVEIKLRLSFVFHRKVCARLRSGPNQTMRL